MNEPMDCRFDWTGEEVFQLITSPLEDLCRKAQVVHRRYADQDIQKCKLLSIKTGGCREDCGYCSQSAYYKTGLGSEPLLSSSQVEESAREAKQQGATRFCLGAAWRDIPHDERFANVLTMIRNVAKQGLEVCCTLGMATESQLQAMYEAGLTAYNHNLDTSREYYPKIISTRTYDDRLETLQLARRVGIKLCCGGILGMGESIEDRVGLLVELATMNPHPESVPINLLVPIEGTPLERQKKVPFEEFLRVVAVARILMPKSRVRLSAGRNSLTEKEQLKCFHVGANSIFIGEKLLTTSNVAEWTDGSLLANYRPGVYNS